MAAYSVGSSPYTTNRFSVYIRIWWTYPLADLPFNVAALFQEVIQGCEPSIAFKISENHGWTYTCKDDVKTRGGVQRRPAMLRSRQ